MRYFGAKICIVLPLMLLAAGCNLADLEVRFAPKEVQKQSAAILDQGIDSVESVVVRLDLADEVRNRFLSVIAEMKLASKNCIAYFGNPKIPVLSGAAGNLKILKAAELIAPQRPTFEETANAGIDSLERGVSTGFELADRLLILAGGVAGAWGVGKVRRRITAGREALAGYKERADLTTVALREVVKANDAIPDGAAKDAMVAAQKNGQTTPTRDLVREVRRST